MASRMGGRRRSWLFFLLNFWRIFPFSLLLTLSLAGIGLVELPDEVEDSVEVLFRLPGVVFRRIILPFDKILILCTVESLKKKRVTLSQMASTL